MKAFLFLAVTTALLPAGFGGSDEAVESTHARTTVLDVFELSPEQFATLMSKNDE
jgi:hypothetical protein